MIDLPEGAVLPAERLAHRLEHTGRRIGERGRFRQHAGGLVEDPLVGAARARRGRRRRPGGTVSSMRSPHLSTVVSITLPGLLTLGGLLGAMAATTRSRRRILIVDDDRALRHVLSALLIGAGHVVEQAGDGPEALARLDAGGFDIVLLDVNLPGMSGLDVLAHARRAVAPPIVIMMTADDTPATLLSRRARAGLPLPPQAVCARRHRRSDRRGGPRRRRRCRSRSSRPGRSGWSWWRRARWRWPTASSRSCMQLETNLPEPVREAVAQAFRELLNNAIEWGGKLDPHAEGPDLVPAREAPAALPHRRPGRRLRHRQAAARGDRQSRRLAARACAVREEQGLRPGGLGLMMTRSLVDELIYNEARNEVVFIKYLD